MLKEMAGEVVSFEKEKLGEDRVLVVVSSPYIDQVDEMAEGMGVAGMLGEQEHTLEVKLQMHQNMGQLASSIDETDTYSSLLQNGRFMVRN